MDSSGLFPLYCTWDVDRYFGFDSQYLLLTLAWRVLHQTQFLQTLATG